MASRTGVGCTDLPCANRKEDRNAPHAPMYPLPTVKNGPAKVVMPAPQIHQKKRKPQT